MKIKKTTEARTRVQSVAFYEHNFDFRLVFYVFFESTTKPERECRKCSFESPKIDSEGKLLWFSNCTQKKRYKN